MGDGARIDFFPPVAGEIRFAPETLLTYMDQAGVDKAVLLQGPFYGDMNEYVLHATRTVLRSITSFLAQVVADALSRMRLAAPRPQ